MGKKTAILIGLIAIAAINIFACYGSISLMSYCVFSEIEKILLEAVILITLYKRNCIYTNTGIILLTFLSVCNISALVFGLEYELYEKLNAGIITIALISLLFALKFKISNLK